MNTEKLLKVFNCILFAAVILLSLGAILFTTRFDILIRHDLVFAWGREFLSPEHGRFLATFTNNLLTEIIPETINIHPNDFKPYFISSIKGAGVIAICLLIANSAFLFTKSKLRAGNIAFTIIYALTFCSVFNFGIFYPKEPIEESLFNISEDTVFFEYPMSLFLYIPLWSFIIYYYTNQVYPKKSSYIMLLVIAFLTAISVDPINVPTFFTLIVFSLVWLIGQKFKVPVKALLLSAGFYCSYIAGLLCYFLRPVHHNPDYGNLPFKEYVITFFHKYCIEYWNIFVVQYSKLLIPITILLILLLILRKNYDKSYKRMAGFILTSALCMFIFYFLLFLIGFFVYDAEHPAFFISMGKWVSLYKVITLFWLFVLTGYVIDKNTHINERTSNIIKIILCIVIFAVFHKNLVTGYLENLNSYANEMKELRKAAYIIEKTSLTQGDDKLLVPVEFTKYSDLLFLGEDTCSFYMYVNNVHPEMSKTKIEYTNSPVDMSIFMEDELNNLRFQKLLNHKLYRHKKVIKNCY